MFTKPKTVAGPAIASIQQDTRGAVVMVTPAFLGLLAFIAIPFLLAIFLSTQSLQFCFGLAPSWMRLESYRPILLDPVCSRSFCHSCIDGIASVSHEHAVVDKPR